MNQLTTKQLLSIKAAADALGLSVWTLRSWAYSGKVSSHKLGSRLLVSQAEIDRILTESERPRLESANAK